MLEKCVTYRYDFVIVIKKWPKMSLCKVVFLSLCSMSMYASDELNRQQIQERIKPVGQVRIQTQSDNASPVGINSKTIVQEEKADAGQDTYEQFCIVCHRDGLAGAPKFQDDNDWKPRMTGKTIDDLVTSSINGLNAMPPKGTCSECSEEDLKAAIQYMLPKS